MNEFLPRDMPVASGMSATERTVASVRPIQAVSPVKDATLRTDADQASPNGQRPAQDAAESVAMTGEDSARAFATYSRVHSEIAKVVADLGSSPVVLAQAENRLLSLMPQPSVVLPLPPADRDMVDFVAQVTRSIALQAAQTRAAFSSLAPTAVDAATAA